MYENLWLLQSSWDCETAYNLKSSGLKHFMNNLIEDDLKKTMQT